jgi:drug/metabolite transporter (DMT)-like permease
LITSAPTLNQGRVCIVVASVLWSLGGGLAKVLTRETALGLHEPTLENAGLLIAFYRTLFAGLFFVPSLRRRDLSFRPAMLIMIAFFTAMNVTYVSAMTNGSAANAIFLQYTASMWMYLACVWFLGEPAERRNTIALIFGLLGIAVILFGGWQESQVAALALGIAAGITYAGVVVYLRVLRDASSTWLTMLNHLGAAMLMAPVALACAWPSWPQMGVLFAFGVVQMGIPYWLVAYGLRSVSPQEAGTLMLIEPILNPVWAYVAAGEVPSIYTFIGGACIVGALAWRYAPRGEKSM